jgi:AcrR family transcriptional regulator
VTTEHASTVRSHRRERTRERLLDAAFEVFADQGVQGASIEAVCEAAGFTRGAFYSNFDSKEELFLALVDREMRTHLADLERSVAVVDPATLDTPDGFRAALRSVLATVGADSAEERQWCVMKLEFELLAMRDPVVAARYGVGQQRQRDELAAVLTRLLDGLGLRFTVDVRTAVDLLLSAYEAGTRAALLGAPGDQHPEAVIERLLDVLMAPADPPR